MVKKLVRHGNSLALIIDKPILELLGIDADTELELSTDGRALRITPIPKEAAAHRARVAKSLEKVNEKHGGVLKRLAAGPGAVDDEFEAQLEDLHATHHATLKALAQDGGVHEEFKADVKDVIARHSRSLKQLAES